jgi:hypothetical protein
LSKKNNIFPWGSFGGDGHSVTVSGQCFLSVRPVSDRPDLIIDAIRASGAEWGQSFKRFNVDVFSTGLEFLRRRKKICVFLGGFIFHSNDSML